MKLDRQRVPNVIGQDRRALTAWTAGFFLLGSGAGAAFLPPLGNAGANSASVTSGAEQPIAPREPLLLGTASNFSQGWNPRTYDAAAALSVTRFRDGIRWSEVERSPGSYTFDKATTTYMARLGQRGDRLTLTVNWGNPLYDAGKTPHTARALAAFGKFVAAMAARYPAIDTIEVGNEFNGANFVSGPVKAADLAKRGQYHLAMVRSAANAVKSVQPDVRVLGGATHSLPAGYLWPLLDGEGAHLFDGLAVHPYTTPIDQLATQIGVLRRHPAARTMPLHVTEFGSRDPDRAGDDLVRAYAVMASLGVRELDWYPLNDRGDGHVPLINRDLSLTSAGKAFRMVKERLARSPGRDISPDRFTFIHAFGPNTWVMWGAPRSVRVDADSVVVFDATGTHRPVGDHVLSEDRVLVLVGKQSLGLGGNVALGCSPLIADSFYQFGYPHAGQTRVDGDPFQRFARSGGRELPFETLPGQQRNNVPWNPYLGISDLPQLRLSADSMLPALRGGDAAIVHRYIAPQDMVVTLRAGFTPSADSADGIGVEVARNGRVLFERSGKAPISVDLQMRLAPGDILSLATSPDRTTAGDTTDYRIRLFDERRCGGSRGNVPG